MATATVIVPEEYASRLVEVRQALIHLGLEMHVRTYDPREGIPPIPDRPASAEKCWHNGGQDKNLTAFRLVQMIQEGVTLFSYTHRDGRFRRLRVYQEWALLATTSTFNRQDPIYVFKGYPLEEFKVEILRGARSHNGSAEWAIVDLTKKGEIYALGNLSLLTLRMGWDGTCPQAG